MKDFKVLKEVGKGSYGRVFKVDLKGQVLALKQVSKDIVIKTGKIASIHFEKDVLQKAKTESMPRFHFTFQVSIAYLELHSLLLSALWPNRLETKPRLFTARLKEALSFFGQVSWLIIELFLAIHTSGGRNLQMFLSLSVLLL